MKYNFKYKYDSYKQGKGYKRFFVDYMSKLIFWLYSNKVYQWLRLNKNNHLRYVVDRLKEEKYKLNLESNIPDNLQLSVQSITLMDCVEVEDYDKFLSRFIDFSSKYSVPIFSRSVGELIELFDKFKTQYKTTSFGELYKIDTKSSGRMDLVDSVSISYIKGQNGQLIILYKLNPSSLFREMFNTSLVKPLDGKYNIELNSVKQILIKGKLISSVGIKFDNEDYETNKLFCEISYQFKRVFLDKLYVGFFNKKGNVLLPRIVNFEYDVEEIKLYKFDLFKRLNIAAYEEYSSENGIFSLKVPDYTQGNVNGMEVFLPKMNQTGDEVDYVKSVDYISNQINKSIAPFWLLINAARVVVPDISNYRIQTYKYFKKNKASLFIKNIIKLRNQITFDRISFDRICTEFSNDWFRQRLNSRGLSDAKRKPIYDGENPDDYVVDMLNISDYSISEIKSAFDELKDLNQVITDDHSIRANMKLQRLLLIFAIVGVVLALYSANSEWCNSGIKSILKMLISNFPSPSG